MFVKLTTVEQSTCPLFDIFLRSAPKHTVRSVTDRIGSNSYGEDTGIIRLVLAPLYFLC